MARIADSAFFAGHLCSINMTLNRHSNSLKHRMNIGAEVAGQPLKIILFFECQMGSAAIRRLAFAELSRGDQIASIMDPIDSIGVILTGIDAV